ncbi:hypothetical protein [Nodularia sp. UHCC 0506]|uniref:hypothetical protein n=1 Tax=Nodularia sp. UHCC 0506 TaxID=3110243 RepID=UPI002B215784|nr:hypothetical protein [Nodularia sp. UHCC 0506]MEA5514545.1 hypothetical protein [Nodularia sp. UHCC 0506]
MNDTLSNPPEYVIINLDKLKQIWAERCKIIENNEKGDYSRHLLLLLNDLREEIHNNENRFSKNAYGKKFFKTQIATYCTFKKEQIDELDKIKRLWTQEVNQELYFIAEALSDDAIKFQLDDISILTQRIENKLTSEDSFGKIIDILHEKLIEEKLNYDLMGFLIDTIIILFNAKGMLELDSTLDDQFEKFEDILTSPEKDNLYPMVSGSPSKGTKSIDEYREDIKNYYQGLTIKQRLSLLKEVYRREPQTYRIIFNITGVKFSENFTIGKVEFYRPQIHGKYIKENGILSRDLESKSDYCIAVVIRGVDSKFMRIKAQQMAERTIAVLSTRQRKDQAIFLSKDWVICDTQGEIRGFSFKGKDKQQTIESQNNRQRLGQWISSENICHPTVAKWLSSTDWYRQATEASQSSQEILNSWFAVEKFSEDSKILSKRLPKLSQKLSSNNKIFKETIDLWLEGDGIRTVQLLLVLSELKFNLYNKLRQVAYSFISPLVHNELRISKSIAQDLQDYLSANKDEIDILDKFIEKIPEIKKQLDAKAIETQALNEVHKIFYDNDYCEKYLIEKIIELKDDVYNIYRIRNMLVHSSSTKSKLLDYYAKRSREYCHSLLYAIAYKIYQTSHDDEIMPLEFYFREMVIDTNIALEAVKNNEMDKFRKWALS